MNHVMKGNIGLFISAGENISGNQITISNIISKGNNVGSTQLRPIEPDPPLKKGLNSHSLLITGSNNIKINNSNNRILNSVSQHGDDTRIKLVGSNRNIFIS